MTCTLLKKQAQHDEYSLIQWSINQWMFEWVLLRGRMAYMLHLAPVYVHLKGLALVNFIKLAGWVKGQFLKYHCHILSDETYRLETNV